MKSDADQGSWGLCSCVGTDRDDHGKTTPAHITDSDTALGKGDDPLSGPKADNFSADNLLSHEQGETINPGGSNWPLQSSSGAIIREQVIQAPEKGRPFVLVSINTQLPSSKGKGVGG